MGLGPIEVLVVGFPDSELNDGILTALEDVVDRQIVSIVDGLLITKRDDEDIEFSEIEDGDADGGRGRLAQLMEKANGLLNDEDVHAFAEAMSPGDTAVALVLEHTWTAPFHEAVAGSGGSIVADMRVPGSVVDDVLEAVDREARE